MLILHKTEFPASKAEHNNTRKVIQRMLGLLFHLFNYIKVLTLVEKTNCLATVLELTFKCYLKSEFSPFCCFALYVLSSTSKLSLLHYNVQFQGLTEVLLWLKR